MKSVYHVREYEVHKLKRIQEPVDVFVSHDWPRGIAHYGDKEGLLRVKPYFREEVRWLSVSTYQQGGVLVILQRMIKIGWSSRAGKEPSTFDRVSFRKDCELWGEGRAAQSVAVSKRRSKRKAGRSFYNIGSASIGVLQKNKIRVA
jgi:hypothetical protein